MKQDHLPKYFTQAGMAEVLQVSEWNVRYVVRTRRVESALVVGGRKMFDKAGLNETRRFLQEIAWRNRRSNRAAVAV